VISRIEQKARAVMEKGGAVLLPEDGYTNMKYPKFLPLMRFRVDQYDLSGFGHVMFMHTTTRMEMELITMSFMPSECLALPYLLIDAMSMKNKRCVFVEYYGCGAEGFNDQGIKEVHDRYGPLPDYPEKDNWYIEERMPYSLIKSGDPEALVSMAQDSVKTYLELAEGAASIPDYKDKLKAFRERMIVCGNPSSKTLNMLLGKDGARTFMEKVIMPV